jgi:hypothetical protein
MNRPEPSLQIPIERINNFLDNHTFTISEIIGLPIEDLNIAFKIQITGVETYIAIGDWTDFVEYTIFVQPTDKRSENIYKAMFPNKDVVELNTTDTEFNRLTYLSNDLLSDFLKYFGYNIKCMCKKVVNEMDKVIEESFIFEGKMDSVVRKLVSDIINLVRVQKDGEFELPGDISDDMVYEFTNFETPFSIDLKLVQDENVETFDVDGEFSRDDDTIFITIISNPNIGNTFLYDLTAELNEVLAHELTHIRQHEEGYEFPEEPKKPKKYYSQEHELEAQIRGFRRKAKVTGKSFDDVVKDWFEKNEHKHRLKPKQVEKIIEKLKQLR